jgi:hypothetical protein
MSIELKNALPVSTAFAAAAILPGRLQRYDVFAAEQ